MAERLPFPVSPVLTGISLAYSNRRLIADDLLPRVPVAGRTFTWYHHAQNERMTIPQTLVGRKARPNEVEFTATEQPGQVYDYGLDSVIPNDDVATAPAGYDPVGNAVQGLTELIQLDREVRVANKVFDPATYGAANKDQLTGTEYWDDPDSNPVEYILDILAVPALRPNVAVFSRKVADRLRQHPKVVAAANAGGGNAAAGGIASMEALKVMFDLEDIYIGDSFVNTAKPGQAAVLAKAWGNHAAFIHRNRLAGSGQQLMTFGFTAQWGSRVAGTMNEPVTGLRGSLRARVGESVNELISAPDLGYFVEDAITP